MLPALVIGGLGWWLLATASGGFGATPRLLFGMGFIVMAAIVVAAPLARLIAEPTGNLFYPAKRRSRPLPMYSIPQAKRKQGHYEEAIAGFEQIAADYPGEVKPYIEMVDIAIMDLKDPDRAKAIFQRGVATLKKHEDQETLARMYRAIRPHDKPQGSHAQRRPTVRRPSDTEPIQPILSG